MFQYVSICFNLFQHVTVCFNLLNCASIFLLVLCLKSKYNTELKSRPDSGNSMESNCWCAREDIYSPSQFSSGISTLISRIQMPIYKYRNSDYRILKMTHHWTMAIQTSEPWPSIPLSNDHPSPGHHIR